MPQVEVHVPHGSLDPSHVLFAMGVPNELAQGSLRIAIGKNNTREEIENLIKNLVEIVERLRKKLPQ